MGLVQRADQYGLAPSSFPARGSRCIQLFASIWGMMRKGRTTREAPATCNEAATVNKTVAEVGRKNSAMLPKDGANIRVRQVVSACYRADRFIWHTGAPDQRRHRRQRGCQHVVPCSKPMEWNMQGALGAVSDLHTVTSSHPHPHQSIAEFLSRFR